MWLVEPDHDLCRAVYELSSASARLSGPDLVKSDASQQAFEVAIAKSAPAAPKLVLELFDLGHLGPGL